MEMVELLSLFFLGIAVSIDSFMVAFSYGLKRLTLAKPMVVLIGLCSGLAFGLAMMAGQLLSLLMNEFVISLIGAILLIGLGVYSLITFDQEKTVTEKQYDIELKRLGIVIRILKKPVLADLDQSGDIAGLEVVWLAIALSIDASVAGLGASLVGIDLIAMGLIFIMTTAFLALGLYIGRKFAKKELQGWVRYIPGLLLILIGVSRLLLS